MISQSGTVVTNVVSGKTISFFVSDPGDVIQRHHLRGEFYEIEELEIISEYFPIGGVYVDVGANVGNHTIFVCKFLYPSQAIIFEPNPPAIDILNINLSLNRLHFKVDSTHVGVGLSDTTGIAQAVTPLANLGATRLQPTDTDTGITLVVGDRVLEHRKVDFIKLDVEGMEMSVLSGLKGTIDTWRPAIFVEVDNINAALFSKWLTDNRYSIARAFRRYPQNENFMVVPVERS